MFNTPFFSIVIPTKDRPKYLVDSIRSVLLQDYNNYEIIVSDNYSDDRTIHACKEFIDKNQIKYIRPDRELNMIDHWEFATKKASGEYILVLPDRKLLYYGALKKLQSKIAQSSKKFNCISYYVRHYDDVNNKMLWSPSRKKTTVFKSNELIDNFLNKNYFTSESLDICFPKTLNSCFRREFAENVRIKLGSYFNLNGVSTPDYSSFFINTLLNSEVLFINTPIILAQGEHVSNGRNFGKGHVKSYIESLGNIDPYLFVPIKAPFIYNLLVNDFMLIQHLLLDKKYSINKLNYFYTNYYEYKIYKLNPENSNFQFINELDRALQFETKELKNSLRNKLILAEKQIEEFRKSKIRIRRFHLHIKDYIVHNYSSLRLINKVFKHKFNSSLEAAGFK